MYKVPCLIEFGSKGSLPGQDQSANRQCNAEYRGDNACQFILVKLLPAINQKVPGHIRKEDHGKNKADQSVHQHHDLVGKAER